MQKEGLEQPVAVTKAINQYREESNTVGQFIKECLVKTGMDTLLKNVHADYEKWCEEHGNKPFSSRNLASELRKKGIQVENGTGNKIYVFGYSLIC